MKDVSLTKALVNLLQTDLSACNNYFSCSSQGDRTGKFNRPLFVKNAAINFSLIKSKPSVVKCPLDVFLKYSLTHFGYYDTTISSKWLLQCQDLVWTWKELIVLSNVGGWLPQVTHNITLKSQNHCLILSYC